jgi:hypothetical protein
MGARRGQYRLTLDDHRALGLTLANANDALTSAFVFFANHYPGGEKSDLVKLIDRAEKALSKARCELDEVVCAEQPDRPNADALSAYYPDGEKRQRLLLSPVPRRAVGSRYRAKPRRRRLVQARHVPGSHHDVLQPSRL